MNQIDIQPNPLWPAHNPRKLLILIVEDYVVFSRQVKKALQEHEVVLAATAEEAVKKYKEHLPDITLLDINLPDGDGHTVLMHILDFDPGAYVVMMTGSNLADDVVKSKQIGAQGYIVKPFTHAKVAKYIEHYYAHMEGKEQELVGAGPLAQKEPLPPLKQKNTKDELIEERKQDLKILFVDDFLANRSSVCHQLEKAGFSVDVASTAQEAYDMIQEHNYQLVFMDCELPDENSYFITNRIRHNDRVNKKDRVIIGMGSKHAPDAKEQWLQAGMNGYLQKPFPVKKIQEVIHKRMEDIFDDIIAD